LKTLKDKFNAFYFCIVLFIILIVGVTSAINLYSIRNRIDKLMVNNYNSIKACTNMLSFLREQNSDLLAYINTNDVKKSESLYTNTSGFYKWFNAERNNITEPNEKNLVDLVNKDYVKYMSQLPKFQQFKNENGADASNIYYENSIKPVYSRVIKNLENISNLNEAAMINDKNNLRNSTEQLLYLTLFLSIAAVIIGFLTANYFINKFLKPLYSLNETIKSIKEGNLDIEAPVISEDEVGEVTKEFNKMTKRLREYENSNAGQLLNEKNKSLAIVKSISDPLVVLDTDFRFKLLNHAFENVFNITEKNAIDKHFLEIINNSELYKHIFSVINANEDRNPAKIIQEQRR
jgi:nitrogen fixation/metabolism regulation signal transduction histidine kinase